MPKVLVLFDSSDHGADELAQLAAEGAKRVRFTEVDVRVVGEEKSRDGARRVRLDSVNAVDQYDGVIVVGSDHDIAAPIDALLVGIQRSTTGEFVDRVFAAVSGDNSATRRLSAAGGIVVGVRAGVADVETEARRTGERVAQVAEWVRHAHSHGH